MTDQQKQADEDCVWCERIWAAVGLVLGLGLAYIAVDTFTEGRLTQVLVRSAPRLASVTPLRSPENEAS